MEKFDEILSIENRLVKLYEDGIIKPGSKSFNIVKEEAEEYYGKENVKVTWNIYDILNRCDSTYDREKKIKLINEELDILEKSDQKGKVLNLEDILFTQYYKYTLVVKFEKPTITNELKMSHTMVGNLFARLSFGKLLFAGEVLFNRDTYTQSEINKDYMHSHVQGISATRNSYIGSGYKPVCLGTSPIRKTLETIHIGPEELMLLFRELDLLVTTESIKGIPYRPMSSLTRSSSYEGTLLGYSRNVMSLGNYTGYIEEAAFPIRSHIRHLFQGFFNDLYLNDIIKFTIHDDRITLNDTVDNVLYLMSNAFFKYYQTIKNLPNIPSLVKLQEHGYINKATLDDFGKFRRLHNYTSQTPFRFNDGEICESIGGNNYYYSTIVNKEDKIDIYLILDMCILTSYIKLYTTLLMKQYSEPVNKQLLPYEYDYSTTDFKGTEIEYLF